MKISADYRMLALDALRGKWKTAVLTGIAASALGATIVSSSNSVVSNSNQAKDIHFNLFAQPNGGRLLAVLLVGIGLWAILQLIVGGAVQLGYAHFNLNLVDGNDAAISDLFSQKDRLWDGFCMKFLQGLVHRPLVAAVGDSGNRENIQLCDDTLHHVRTSFADRK